MKIFNKVMIVMLCVFSLNGAFGQTGKFVGSVVPIKPESPMFANDIVIHDSSTQNQRKVKICSAFNGWLYAVYTNYFTKYHCNCPGFTILKSTDNGITWSIIDETYTSPNVDTISSIDIAVGGDSISNLKVFLSTVLLSGSIEFPGEGQITRFDANGNYIDGITFQNGITSIALSTDVNFTASNSSPFKVGVLYASSTSYPVLQDSVVFIISSNGGSTFDNYKEIESGTTQCYNLSLTYGRSPSFNSGIYFGAWTKTQNFTNLTGSIFTAHSSLDLNSPFTKPVCLDSLDPTGSNKFRNPIIACQFSGVDNDSSNLTEIVVAEKQLSANSYDTRGFYNLQAATSNHFSEFSLVTSSNNKTEPDISFNPYSSSFMMTFYDSTQKSLPFITNDVNLSNPGSWNIITNAYNDSPDIVAPYPKVALNPGTLQGVNVWVKEGIGGNGVALFDAPNHYFTGISGGNITNTNLLFQIFPNPCNSLLNISFELNNTSNIKISLYNQVNECVGTIVDHSFSEGKNLIQYDVSHLVSGSYLLTFQGETDFQTHKLFIVR